MSAFKLALPSLSPTMEKGTIAEWKIKEGDYIESGTIIAAIATDKSTVDYESLDEGYLKKIIVPAGGECLVGDLIAILTEEENDPWEEFLAEELEKIKAAQEAAAAPALSEDDTEENDTAVAAPTPVTSTGATGPVIVPAAPAPKEVPQPKGTPKTEGVRVSPAAKKVAKQRNINLGAVEPKTTGSRIVLADLENLPDGYGMSYGERSTGLVGHVNRASNPHVDETMNQMRSAIANRMVQASSGVPVFFLTVSVEMDNLIALRKQLNEMDGIKISVNDFIVKATALALREHPNVNAAYQGSYIRKFNDVDVSVAVSIDGGLITPIVRSADTKGLKSISTDVKELVGKAKNGTLTPEEYQGGSFTVSNLGMFGIDSFTAILNPPQAAIMAIGGTHEELRLVDGQVKAVSVCKMTLTSDHRVIDGALAAEFMNSVKALLESPVKLVL